MVVGNDENCFFLQKKCPFKAIFFALLAYLSNLYPIPHTVRM